MKPKNTDNSAENFNIEKIYALPYSNQLKIFEEPVENEISLNNSADQKLKILLVEDNKTYSMICLKILEKEKLYSMTCVDTVHEAIGLLNKVKFDLILLDLTLPDEQGLNTFRKINENSHGIPVVIMTGVEDDQLALQIVREGAQDYLIKSYINKFTLIRSIRYAIERFKLTEKVFFLSLTDELTGLYNRRAFFLIAEKYLKLAKRENFNILILFIDLDFMKKINDTHGHLIGDSALKALAEILIKTFRESDVIARMGGDEFLILMQHTNINQFYVVVERFRENLKKFNSKEDSLYKLSLSIGGAYSDIKKLDSIEKLILKADNALYEHKKSKSQPDREFANIVS